MRGQLEEIDARLWEYVSDATAPVATPFAPDDTTASLHELLCIRKALRKMATYPLDPDYALRWLRAIEGTWQDGEWQSGGVKFDTHRGAQHVRLMPYQVWAVIHMMMPQQDVVLEV